MDIALLGFGSKDMDQVLAMIMFALVAVATAGVVFLLCRHTHACRKAKKHAKNSKHPHPHRS